MTPGPGHFESLDAALRRAMLLEAASPKLGNVHPAARFEEMGFAECIVSADLVADQIVEAMRSGERVGRAIHDATRHVADQLGVNTHLGTVMLLAPLAAAAADVQSPADWPGSIDTVLARLGPADTADLYAAIRVARPGGLGEVEHGDIHGPTPRTNLVTLMTQAAGRDRVARQYATGFRDVFRTADTMAREAGPVDRAIQRAQLRELAAEGDTHVARVRGAEANAALRARAAAVWRDGAGEVGPASDAWRELDAWCREPGAKRNSGATADLLAAACFVLLWDGRWVEPLAWAGPLELAADETDQEPEHLAPDGEMQQEPEDRS